MKDQILKAAVTLAVRGGLNKLTRHAIAKAAKVSYGSVFNHLGDMPETRTAVIEYAVAHEILPIIVDGIVARHPAALGAPLALRQKAMNASLG